jgi:anti-sigma factor (TIGR02949 family)
MSAHKHDARCLDLAEQISEFIDLELPPDLRQRVEEHLSACANCVKFVDSLRRTRDVAALLPRAELSPEQLRELGEAVRRRLES